MLEVKQPSCSTVFRWEALRYVVIGAALEVSLNLAKRPSSDVERIHAAGAFRETKLSQVSHFDLSGVRAASREAGTNKLYRLGTCNIVSESILVFFICVQAYLGCPAAIHIIPSVGIIST